MTGYQGGELGPSDDWLDSFENWCDFVADGLPPTPAQVVELAQNARMLSGLVWKLREELA